MKVVQLVQHLKTGGLENMAVDLLLNSQFSESTYIVALEGTFADAVQAFPRLAACRERVVCLGKRPGWQFSIALVLAKLFKYWGIDTVHSHHIGPLIYASMAQRQCSGLQHIHTIHDAWFLKTFRYRMLFRLFSSMSKVTLIADANSVAQDVANLAGIKVAQTILNGIDTSRFNKGKKSPARQSLGLPNTGYLVGCAARLVPGKGHEAMLRALLELPQDVSVVIAGEGPLQAPLQDLCQQLGIAQRVHWLGKCDEMPAFYQAIDTFCLFSEREGLPLSILEAIASCTPIVSTKVGAIPEVVDKNTGLLIDPQHAQKLGKTLLKSLFAPSSNSQDNTSAMRRLIDVRTMSQQYDAVY